VGVVLNGGSCGLGACVGIGWCGYCFLWGFVFWVRDFGPEKFVVIFVYVRFSLVWEVVRRLCLNVLCFTREILWLFFGVRISMCGLEMVLEYWVCVL